MAVRLTWGDTNSIEEGHRVYRSTSPIDPHALPAPLATLPAGSTEYVDSTAAPSTTYYYRVSAFLLTLEQVATEVTVTTGAPAAKTKIMLSLDVLDRGLDNNLLLSGDAQSGGDLLII